MVNGLVILVVRTSSHRLNRRWQNRSKISTLLKDREPLTRHGHPVHRPTAQASGQAAACWRRPSAERGSRPTLRIHAEEFDDEEEEMPKEAQSALGQGLSKKKSSQWERVDVESFEANSIFDKTFYRRCIP